MEVREKSGMLALFNCYNCHNVILVEQLAEKSYFMIDPPDTLVYSKVWSAP